MVANQGVEVGTKIIFRVLITALIVGLLYLLRDVVLIVFLAVLTAAALSPAVMRLKRIGFSRTSAVILTYVILFFGIIALVSSFIPLLLEEIKDFISKWPLYVERLSVIIANVQSYLQPLGIAFDKEILFSSMEQNVRSGFSGIFSTTINFFSGVITVLGFFFLSLYLSLEERGIEKFFLLLAPKQYHEYALSIAERTQNKVSQWLFGQLLLMLIVFGMYFIGLSALGVPYALAVAFFGGVMEIIPYVGPIIAVVPAVILGLLVSPMMGFLVFIFYLVAHQLEAHIIAPQVLKRSIGLSPVVIIITILTGAKLAGPLGVLISIPIVMILSVFVEDFLEKRQI